MDDEPNEPTPEETRQVMRRVAEYRKVCEHVRSRGAHSLIFGLMMLGFWYYIYMVLTKEPWGVFSVIALSLAVLEICVGLYQRFFPAAEGLLFDGIVMLAFAASNGVRAFLWWKAGQGIDYVFIGFSVLWVFNAMNILRSYVSLVRRLPSRPTRAQLRWFNALLADLRDADPKLDPRAVAIPTHPFLTGLLFGESAFFLDPNGEIIIADRRDVVMEFENSPDPDKPPRGYLSIGRLDFPPFKLSPANWENYAAWKRDGGEDPLRS
jgi:hypothetical protein